MEFSTLKKYSGNRRRTAQRYNNVRPTKHGATFSAAVFVYRSSATRPRATSMVVGWGGVGGVVRALSNRRRRRPPAIILERAERRTTDRPTDSRSADNGRTIRSEEPSHRRRSRPSVLWIEPPETFSPTPPPARRRPRHGHGERQADFQGRRHRAQQGRPGQ